MQNVAKISVVFDEHSSHYIITETIDSEVRTTIKSRRDMRNYLNRLKLPNHIFEHIQNHIREQTQSKIATFEY